ncbi:MAG: TraR/DksA C4-type zinc finger protein [Acidobacteria bacterium]|nr:TraR/DksA C4-type zinc finger protein [Acidobacteriota bacterium]MBI3656667.1 TraR/DksA C4-type zinc finger protein [Acidobacteriota bacterium]
MNRTDLLRYKRKLNLAVRNLESSLAANFMELLTPRDSNPVDLEERAEQDFEQERILQVCQEKSRRYKAILRALARINSATFGQCQNCGKGVGKKRLETIPWTEFCLRCQTQCDELNHHRLEAGRFGQRLKAWRRFLPRLEREGFRRRCRDL